MPLSSLFLSTGFFKLFWRLRDRQLSLRSLLASFPCPALSLNPHPKVHVRALRVSSGAAPVSCSRTQTGLWDPSAGFTGIAAWGALHRERLGVVNGRTKDYEIRDQEASS